MVMQDKRNQQDTEQGGLPPVPARPVKKTGQAARLYYEKYRVDIQADLANLGEQVTRKRWGISCATMLRLKGRWGKNKPVETAANSQTEVQCNRQYELAYLKGWQAAMREVLAAGRPSIPDKPSGDS